MSNRETHPNVKADVLYGRAIGAGLFRGSVIGSGIGLGLGMALQAMGVLDMTHATQLFLFTVETGMIGAVIGGLWKGHTARRSQN